MLWYPQHSQWVCSLTDFDKPHETSLVIFCLICFFCWEMNLNKPGICPVAQRMYQRVLKQLNGCQPLLLLQQIASSKHNEGGPLTTLERLVLNSLRRINLRLEHDAVVQHGRGPVKTYFSCHSISKRKYLPTSKNTIDRLVLCVVDLETLEIFSYKLRLRVSGYT